MDVEKKRQRQRRADAKRRGRTRERSQAQRDAERRYEAGRGRVTRAAYAASDAGRSSRARYESSDTGKQTRERSRRERQTRAYLDRRVIALDGEGITGPDGKHRYVYLAASTGESLLDPAGLGTLVVFSWLLELSARYPGALFVGFGFDYDVNMILKDVPREHVETLDDTETVKAGAWVIRYRPGRFFGVIDANGGGRVTVWDVRSYWRSTFVDAVMDSFGDVPAVIVDGKNGRAGFTLDDLDAIAGYNAAELELLVALVERLRAGLDRVGIRPGRWDGPGAVASVLLKRHNVADTLEFPPVEVAQVSQYAFYGGRVECVKYGNSERGAWQYDMRSAYPWALTQIPNWAGGTWVHHKTDPGPLPYTIYDVKWWNWFDGFFPAPLPWRTENNAVTFPYVGRGWYWSPEVDVVRDMAGFGTFSIGEAWQFVPAVSDMPWEWVRGEYERRRDLQDAGEDAAAGALKLGLAALWGKTAQRLGYTKDPLVLPRFHHMPTAGLVTSHVRAEVYRVAFADPEAVVAIETDAVVTSRRLQPRSGVPVRREWLPDVGTGLGQWSETRLDVLTYCGSGAAFWERDAQVGKRTAGVSSRGLTRERVLEGMRAGHTFIEVDVERFNTMGVAREIGWDRWLTWDTVVEAWPLRPQGKREAWGRLSPISGRWNYTVCPVVPEGFTHVHPLPWTMEEAQRVAWERRERMARIQALPS